jgi:hypothetical protein
LARGNEKIDRGEAAGVADPKFTRYRRGVFRALSGAAGTAR